MIVVLAVFLAALFSQSAGELREPVDCSKMDFTNLDKLCNKAKRFGDLVPQSLMKKCISKTIKKDVAQWANVFMMHKLMNGKKNNIIELNTTKNANLLCPAANFINCVATSIGWLLPNGSYNKEAADALLRMNKYEDYSVVLLLLNENEHPEFDSVHVIADTPYACPGAKKNSKPVMTNIHPLFTVQYLLSYIPTFVDPDMNDKKCLKNMEEFIHCTWNVYAGYEMSMRSKEEAEIAIAKLELLNEIVAKNFPNHMHVSLKRA